SATVKISQKVGIQRGFSGVVVTADGHIITCAHHGRLPGEDVLVSFAGGDTSLTEQAASQGIDGVNAAMAFGTDGELPALGLVILEDPLGAQPIYEPTPIVRGVIFDQYPELATILDPVFATLDTETLQELNAKVGLEGQLPIDVARDYLTEKGFL
ncbi:MAG: glycine betaine ABC transporter substrate-binding protein, partial [Dehalococcoidales bacterium]